MIHPEQSARVPPPSDYEQPKGSRQCRLHHRVLSHCRDTSDSQYRFLPMPRCWQRKSKFFAALRSCQKLCRVKDGAAARSLHLHPPVPRPRWGLWSSNSCAHQLCAHLSALGDGPKRGGPRLAVTRTQQGTVLVGLPSSHNVRSFFSLLRA
jgi:hypothetical protein